MTLQSPYSSRNEVLEAFKQIIVDRMEIRPEDLTEDTPVNNLGLDSLDQAEIIMAAEEEFGVALDDDSGETALATMTVGQVTDRIWSCLGHH